MASDNKLVIAPLADLDSDNPYLNLFYDSLKEGGVEVRKGLKFTRKDIWRNRKTVDVFHFHWYPARDRFFPAIKDILSLICKVLLCKALGKRLMYTGHNILPHDKKNTRMQFVKRFVLVHSVDLILVHFKESGEIFAKTFGISERKIIVMHHGLYTGAYLNNTDKAQARRALSIPEGDTVFLFFGFIVPYKNIETLISAFKKYQRPGVSLVLAGAVNDTKYAAEMKALIGDDKRIRSYFQKIPMDTVQWYMNSADCFVLPYRNIYTSGTSMLALTFRKPVILKKCPFSVEYLNARNSIQPDACEEKDLIAAMDDFMARRESFEVREEDIRRFEWSHIGRQLLNDPKAKKVFTRR